MKPINLNQIPVIDSKLSKEEVLENQVKGLKEADGLNR